MLLTWAKRVPVTAKNAASVGCARTFDIRTCDMFKNDAMPRRISESYAQEAICKSFFRILDMASSEPAEVVNIMYTPTCSGAVYQQCAADSTENRLSSGCRSCVILHIDSMQCAHLM